MKKSKTLFLISLLFPTMVGVISALLTRNDMQLYQALEKPALSPPAIVFPIAWTILYLMMGAATYLAITSNTSSQRRMQAIVWYLLQLTMNFLWSIFFFHLKWYLFAFVWLIGMFVSIIICTILYFRLDTRAGWLMVPYNLWMTFAAYLNLSIVITDV